MAEPAIDWQASDLFAMAAQFHEQDSSSIQTSDPANMMDKDGNIVDRRAGRIRSGPC